jgi:dienelactone hydrolase
VPLIPSPSRRRRRCGPLGAAVLTGAFCSAAAGAQTPQTISIRGHAQTLHLYGDNTGDPVIVSSGDGGWIHLGPHVADLLRRNGYFVVGFDVKEYLSSFTAGTAALGEQEEPGDYRALAAFASRANRKKPILIGVSEGAGLSVLAATAPETKTAIGGVIALGLPNLNELAWRWKDSLIYLTHRTPNEPTFNAAAIIDQVAPTPLAAIHSTRDEFVPVGEVQELLRRAREPKKLWIVNASDHRFSDNLSEFDRRLLEALEWIRQHAAP